MPVVGGEELDVFLKVGRVREMSDDGHEEEVEVGFLVDCASDELGLEMLVGGRLAQQKIVKIRISFHS